MEDVKKSIWMLRWMALLLCCIGLFYAKSAAVYAGNLTGVANLHQKDAKTNSFKVEWNKDVNAEAYEFQYSADGSSWSKGTMVYNVYHSVYGLNSGRSYYVRMRSCAGRKLGTYTVFSAWTAPLEVITAPERVKSEDMKQTDGTAKTITVSWKPAAGASFYEVMYEKNGSWFSAGTTTSAGYTIKGLETDTLYYVSVKAVRRSRTGFESGYYYSGGHRCYTTAPKVTGCTLKSWDTATNNIMLKWDSVTKYGNGYEVRIYNLSGKRIKSFKTAYRSKDFKLSSVKNKGFTFQVRAYKDIDGKSIYGPWSGKKVVIPQPRVILKKKGNSQMQLSWKKVSGASSYTIYRSTSSYRGFKKVKTVKTTKYLDKGLERAKTYYYYVVANKVKVKGKPYNSTKAERREIAYLSYSGKTNYIWQ